MWSKIILQIIILRHLNCLHHKSYPNVGIFWFGMGWAEILASIAIRRQVVQQHHAAGFINYEIFASIIQDEIIITLRFECFLIVNCVTHYVWSGDVSNIGNCKLT